LILTKLRAVVVDDETLAREYLKELVEAHPNSTCIASCQNGREALAVIRELKPDLVFLDIEMPGMTGFDVVKALQADTIPLVVFATAFEAYAIKAFEVQAVDYVLKPFHPERIHEAISRANARYALEHQNRKNSYLTAIDHIEPEDSKAETAEFESTAQRLAIKEDDEILLIPYTDIAWIDAAGDYMCVHVGNATHVLRCTMKELENKLKHSSLARIHRSTVVNLDYVKSIKPLPKGECELHLDNDVILKVSRNYRKNIDQLKH